LSQGRGCGCGTTTAQAIILSMWVDRNGLVLEKFCIENAIYKVCSYFTKEFGNRNMELVTQQVACGQ